MKSTTPFRILSIDGGGIRGIIPAAVMIEVEKQVRRFAGDPTLNIGDCFDLIAGTSTGGILTLLALAPAVEAPKRARFSAADALALYTKNGESIFDRGVFKRITSASGLADEKYSADALERHLKEYFGDLRMSELIRPCLVTAYETRTYRPFFFTSHDAVARPAREFYVRDVARATSAAPTYFEAALTESIDGIDNPASMIDGGVFANNPSACALVEAMRLRAGKVLPLAETAMLSLGTGRRSNTLSHKEIRDRGLAGWARPLIDILMEGNAQTVDYQLRTIFESAGHADHYLRIDGCFGDVQNRLDIDGLDAAMDNASADNMKRLETFGRQLAQNAAPQIESFVERFWKPARKVRRTVDVAQTRANPPA